MIVECATIENIVVLDDNDYVNFDNLAITGGNSAGITLNSLHNSTYTNLDIKFNGYNGISTSFVNSSSLLFENCFIAENNNCGIRMSGTLTAAVNNSTFRRNYIYNTGIFMGHLDASSSAGGAGYGAKMTGDDNLIEYNVIENCGAAGLHWYGNDTIVQKNIAIYFCLSLQDLGGFYTWNATSSSIPVPTTGSIFSKNVALYAGGFAPATRTQREGFYFDGNANGITIDGNIAAHCDAGLFFNWSHDVTITNNTTWDNTYGIYFDSGRNQSVASNIDISNNILVARTASQYALFQAQNTDFSTKGTVTISIASPAVVTLSNHQLVLDDVIRFTTTGALPTGIVINTSYYVISTGLTSSAFQFSATLGGAAVNTTGTQSGTQTLILYMPVTITQDNNFFARPSDATPSTSDTLKQGGTEYTYSAWRTAHPSWDANSTISPIGSATTLFDINTSDNTYTLNLPASTYVDKANVSWPTTYVIPANGSAILMKP